MSRPCSFPARLSSDLTTYARLRPRHILMPDVEIHILREVTFRDTPPQYHCLTFPADTFCYFRYAFFFFLFLSGRVAMLRVSRERECASLLLIALMGAR